MAATVRLNRWVLLGAALSVTALLLVQWRLPSDRLQRQSISLPDTRFDYALTAFSSRFQDADGRIELTLAGPRLEHDSLTRVATVQSPQFTLDPDGAAWRGQANQATLARDQAQLWLNGEVLIQREVAHGELAVHSEQLQHDRHARTIRAESEVEVLTPSWRIKAGQALIRLDDDIVEFFDHVEAHWKAADPADGPDRQRLRAR